MTDNETSSEAHDPLSDTQLQSRSARIFKLGLATFPGSCYPGTHLFFSSELKSRIPASSWLSLWKGIPSEVEAEPTRRGWERVVVGVE